MIFDEKKTILKDGRTAILKSPCVEDPLQLAFGFFVHSYIVLPIYHHLFGAYIVIMFLIAER